MILFIVASFLIIFAVIVSNNSLVTWLSPNAADKELVALLQGSTLFKSLLFIDGLLLIYIGLRKQIQNPQHYASLWLAKSINNKQTDSLYLIVLSVICVFAIISHSISINSDLWIDEVLTVVNYVRLDLGQILSNFSSDNQHMLYSALAQICVGFFGETAFAVRLPALLFGLASIPAIASLTRYVFGKKEALFSATLLAVSYHHIWFSQNARGYTILLLGAILSTEYMLRGLETKKWKYWIAYALAITIAAWAHLTAVFIAIAHGMVYLGLLIIKARDSKQNFNYWQPILGFILAAWFTIHVYAISLPQLIDFFSQPSSNATPNPIAWRNPLWLVNEILRNLGVGVALGWFGIISAFLVGLYGLICCAKRDLLFVFLSLAPAVLLGGVMFALDRNLWPRMFFSELGFFAAIAVVGALGFGQLLSNTLNKQIKSIYYAPVILICLFFVLSMPKVYRYPKQDFTSARDYVREHATDQDAVVGVHLAGKMYRIYYAPEWTEINTVEEHNEHKSKKGYTWVLYTLPGFVKSAFPALFKILESDYEHMKTFPGTLGDGNIIVLRSKI